MKQFENEIITLKNGLKYIIIKQLLYNNQTYLFAKNYDEENRRCLPCHVFLKVLEDKDGFCFEIEKDPATIYTIMSFKEVLECMHKV